MLTDKLTESRNELLTYAKASRSRTPINTIGVFSKQLTNLNTRCRHSRCISSFLKMSSDAAKKCFIEILKEIYSRSEPNPNISRYDTIPEGNLAIVFMNGSETQNTTVDVLTSSELGDRSKSFLYNQFESRENLSGIVVGTFYFTNATVIVRTNDVDESSRLLQCYLQIDKNLAGKKSKRKKRMKKTRVKKSL